ncbi:MAG TPA: DNA repair protein RadC [Kiritimatiellia bacterium]|nr:DNA repair protein RadC [Kiritimatiellia bacterium]
MSVTDKTGGHLLREQHYSFSRAMRDVPEAERPREIFDRVGPDGMSDKHLIALILRSGVKGRSVTDLAEGLLNEYGSLGALAEVSAADLAAVKGMGRVRAQVLKAALELARRLASRGEAAPISVRTPEEAARLMRTMAAASDVENFWVLLLDRKYRLRRPPLHITRGILDASLIHPREVFKEAVRTSSAALVLVHNHPSGDPQPSPEDIRITRQLVEAGKVMDIEILDHIIMGRAEPGRTQDYFSLRESGLVAFGG